jgi:hypothetical protein
MIGLDIMVKNSTDNYLYKIFSGIDLTKYIWEISSDEILYSENGVDYQKLFDKSLISGDEFIKCISKESYYMIFSDIKAYPVGSKLTNITTYEDYLKSDCEIILLCADVKFIDFYSKSNEILKKVYKNCINNKFEQVTTITENNNSRTKISVL